MLPDKIFERVSTPRNRHGLVQDRVACEQSLVLKYEDRHASCSVQKFLQENVGKGLGLRSARSEDLEANQDRFWFQTNSPDFFHAMLNLLFQG
jgi:hypothetical protein